jgi:hypothetical protein
VLIRSFTEDGQNVHREAPVTVVSDIDFEPNSELYHVTFSKSEGDFVFNFKYLFTPDIAAVREFHH